MSLWQDPARSLRCMSIGNDLLSVSYLHGHCSNLTFTSDLSDVRMCPSNVGRIEVRPSSLAGVAQLVERLICNQLVEGSNPFAGSIYIKSLREIGGLFLCP